MKSSSYWKKRFIDLENAQNQDAQRTYRQIEHSFDVAQREIQTQINAWYGRYALNNGITMAEARKQLSNRELRELHWDVQEYIKRGRENAVSQQWMKELENASAKYHISRLEALKLRTQNALEVAFGNETDYVESMLNRMYQSSYYHTCYELQKGFNLGWEIGQIDTRKLEKVITKPWAVDGKNFSARVWSNRTEMIGGLHQQLTRTLIQGKAPDEAIKEMTRFLDDKTKNAKYKAGRLVMTEQAFISSAAQRDAFNDLDVEEYEIVATLDSHTSAICAEMDGQHFPMKDYQPGVTAPPFHPYCRSVTVPYFDDEFSFGERAARDADGNTYYVPSDMTYKEWKEKSVLNEEASVNKKPISTITDATINRVKRVKINGLSEEQCDAIHENHKKLLSVSKDENGSNEAAFILTGDFKSSSNPYFGSDDVIVFPPSVFDNKHDIFLMHNHPRNKSFSYMDIVEFLKNDRIKHFSIVKNNGEIEVLTKLETYDKMAVSKMLDRCIKNIAKNKSDIEYEKAIKSFLTKTGKEGFFEWLH